MTPKRITFLLAAGAAVCAVLAGTAASTPAKTAALPAFTPVTPNTLTVNGYVPFEGYWNGTSPTHLTGGLEYRIAQGLAKKFGLAHVVVRSVNFSALTAGLLTKYDIAMADIYPTPARAKVNLYSKCYDPSTIVAVVKRGTPFKTVADLRKLHWGIELGSAPGYVIQNGVKPTSDSRVFQNTAAMMPFLLTGDVDAVANSISDVAKYLKQPQYKNFYIPAQLKFNSPETNNQCGAIQLPKKSPNLAAVNAALTELINSGQIKKWRQQYVVPTFNGINPYKLPIINIR